MDLRRTILELLAGNRGDDRRWGPYFYKALCTHIREPIPRAEMMEALWLLVSEGLVYLDDRDRAPTNWVWCLTRRGQRVVDRECDFEPDDPDGYLARLRTQLPDLDHDVLLYITEALRSFEARCYLAASVMLGVASEKAFLLMAEASLKWPPLAQSTTLAKAVQSDRNHFIYKFTEFRKRLEPAKPQLPADLADNLALTLDAVADLLRVYRNESGHPTGKKVDREEARTHLAIFPAYLRRIWAMKALFEQGSP